MPSSSHLTPFQPIQQSNHQQTQTSTKQHSQNVFPPHPLLLKPHPHPRQRPYPQRRKIRIFPPLALRALRPQHSVRPNVAAEIESGQVSEVDGLAPVATASGNVVFGAWGKREMDEVDGGVRVVFLL